MMAGVRDRGPECAAKNRRKTSPRWVGTVVPNELRLRLPSHGHRRSEHCGPCPTAGLVHNLWFGLPTSLFIMLGVLGHFLPPARLLLEFTPSSLALHEPCSSGAKAGMCPILFGSGHLAP